MIAIAGGKGGCGKTTTTLGLAAAFARQGTTAVAVDADRDMPNLHLLADVDPTPTLAALNRGGSIDTVTHEVPATPDVSVIPAPSGVSDGFVRRALEEVSHLEHPVLVDSPAGATSSAVVPLRVSSAVVLVTTVQPASLRDAAKSAAMARALDVPIAGVVLTCVPTWATTHANHVDDPVRPAIDRRVERLVGAPVIASVPAVETTGRGVLECSAVRRSYDRLATGFHDGEYLFT